MARLDKNTGNGWLAYRENSVKVWIEDIVHSNLSNASASAISKDSIKNLTIALVERTIGLVGEERTGIVPKLRDTSFSHSKRASRSDANSFVIDRSISSTCDTTIQIASI